MKKLNVYLIISMMLVATCAVIFFGFVAATAEENDAPFVVFSGTTGPPKLDPQDCYDTTSSDVIRQVVEGLFISNYTSAEVEPIPNLADGDPVIVADGDKFNYTVALQTGVTFHNGEAFNASSVKWTMDRLQYYTSGIYNLTSGELLFKATGPIESASIFYIGTEPILNHTIILGEHSVRFVLNTAPGFWTKLLAFTATSFMLHDDDYEYGDRFNSFLDLNDELIGTGPYKLVEYVFDEQVVFEAYEDYWNHAARPENYIRNMIYLIVPDAVTRSLAVLNYEIHWGDVIFDYRDEFDADPNLARFTIKTLIKRGIYTVVENQPWETRRATQFAFNYSYYIVDLYQNSRYELHTPVPDGMQYYLEDYVGEPEFNQTYARQLLLDAADPLAAVGTFERNVSDSGLSQSNTTEEWIAVAESTNPIAWYNFTGPTGTDVGYFIPLQNDMAAIGVKIATPLYLDWGAYLDDYLHSKEGQRRMIYHYSGWAPDYNDPINMIDPLYSSTASAGSTLLADATLDQMILDSYTASEFTTPTRETLFHDMQKRITIDLAPSTYLAQSGTDLAYNSLYVDPTSIDDLKNAFEDFYWFNVVFYPPEPVIPGFELITLLAVGLGVTVFMVFYLRKRK
jgi:ABC-type transport system substrate-binding protein